MKVEPYSKLDPNLIKKRAELVKINEKFSQDICNILREAAEENEKIKSYRNQFGIEDNQDLLAMVAFDCLVDKMKNEETIESTDEVALDQLRNISQLIANAI